MTPERLEETISFMRQGDYLFMADFDRGEDDLVAVVDGGALKRVYLHSNLPFKRAYLGLRAKMRDPGFKFLPDDYEIKAHGPDQPGQDRQSDHELLQKPVLEESRSNTPRAVSACWSSWTNT